MVEYKSITGFNHACASQQGTTDGPVGMFPVSRLEGVLWSISSFSKFDPHDPWSNLEYYNHVDQSWNFQFRTLPNYGNNCGLRFMMVYNPNDPDGSKLQNNIWDILDSEPA